MQDILSMSYVKSALEEFEEKANSCQIFLTDTKTLKYSRYTFRQTLRASFFSSYKQALWPEKEKE